MLGKAFVVPKKNKGDEREWGGLKELNFPCHSHFGRKSRLGPVGWVQ